MMMKYCEHCHKEVQSTSKSVKETYTVKGQPIQIMAKVYYCSECGTDLWDDEADEANIQEAYRIYRNMNDLLSPEEIKQIRCKYALSQSAFAKLLGFGEKTITRYENGSIQDKAQNNLIFLMQDINIFKKIWNKNNNILSGIEIEKTELALKRLDDKAECVNVQELYLPTISMRIDSKMFCMLKNSEMTLVPDQVSSIYCM